MNIRATLQPIVVAKFWANRSGDTVFVQIKQFEGRVLIDVRKHCAGADGKMFPTGKGIALPITRLPDLAAAIGKALRQARARQLIAGDQPPDMFDTASATSNKGD
jgi:hypothetical protein